MSDLKHPSLAEIGPEDVAWAAKRLTGLDPIYQDKHRCGIRCMLVAVIFLDFDQGLLGVDPKDPDGFLLKGKLLALSLLLRLQDFRVVLEVGDVDSIMEWSIVHNDDVMSVAYTPVSPSPIEQLSVSPPPATRYLMLIASW